MIVRNGVKLYNYADLSAIFSITEQMVIILFKKLDLAHTRTIINRKCYITQDVIISFTQKYHEYLSNAKMGRKKTIN